MPLKKPNNPEPVAPDNDKAVSVSYSLLLSEHAWIKAQSAKVHRGKPSQWLSAKIREMMDADKASA